MAHITIEVPDELAQHLGPLQGQLSTLFVQWMRPLLHSPDVSLEAGIPQELSIKVYREVLDFLLSRPEPEAILGFCFSEGIRAELGDLRERNRRGELTAMEQAELGWCDQWEHLLVGLKVRSVVQGLAQQGEAGAGWPIGFLERTMGCIQDETFFRHPQGTFEERELFD